MIILGQGKVVVFQDHAKKFTCRYWAERGLIRCEDSRDNSVTTFSSMREVLVRMQKVNEMLGKSTDQGIEVDPQERRRLQKFIEEMIELVRHAREQGNPIDQGHLKYLGKHDPSHLPRRQRVMIPNNYFLD